jgi:hypothetical protein
LGSLEPDEPKGCIHEMERCSLVDWMPERVGFAKPQGLMLLMDVDEPLSVF